MKGADLKAFRKANNLTQSELGEYLGIHKSFVSTIESGKDPMPKGKLSKLLDNPYGWDTSMLVSESNGLEASSLQGRERELTPGDIRSTLENVLKHGTTDYFISYLEGKIADQESLIRELYQQIGALEAKLELARKGETANAVEGSLSADAV